MVPFATPLRFAILPFFISFVFILYGKGSYLIRRSIMVHAASNPHSVKLKKMMLTYFGHNPVDIGKHGSSFSYLVEIIKSVTPFLLALGGAGNVVLI